MATTYIDTLPRRDLGLQGEVAEIVNRELCGAENVVGTLRWLDSGERFDAQPLEDTPTPERRHARAELLAFLKSCRAVLPHDAALAAELRGQLR
jgi:hypothetical protein